MFIYEKKLQYPVKIKNTNPKLASVIISQYGGPDGELGASLRYLSQRYSMPYAELKGLLTDIGTEELGHLEMIGAIVHQLTRDLTEEQIRTAGFDTYFVDRTAGVYPPLVGLSTITQSTDGQSHPSVSSILLHRTLYLLLSKSFKISARSSLLPLTSAALNPWRFNISLNFCDVFTSGRKTTDFLFLQYFSISLAICSR